MSDDRELARKLAALSQPSEVIDGAIQLGSLTGADALAAVLEAIDNTMLPRQLVLRAGEASVTLAVGGRRLRSVTGVSGDLAVPDGLVGRQLGLDDEAELKSVASVLAGLAKKGPLGVAQEELVGGGQSDTGVGISRLRVLWEADPYAAPVPAVDKFLMVLGDQLRAKRFLASADEKVAEGDPKLLAQLDTAYKDRVKAAAAEHAKLYPAAVGARFLTMEGLLDGDVLVTYVELDDDALLIATSADSWPELAKAWPIR